MAPLAFVVVNCKIDVVVQICFDSSVPFNSFCSEKKVCVACNVV